METIIHIKWDEEAGVWYAINDYIPLAMESESLDVLRQKVKDAIPELIELNNLKRLSPVMLRMRS